MMANCQSLKLSKPDVQCQVMPLLQSCCKGCGHRDTCEQLLRQAKVAVVPATHSKVKCCFIAHHPPRLAVAQRQPLVLQADSTCHSCKATDVLSPLLHATKHHLAQHYRGLYRATVSDLLHQHLLWPSTVDVVQQLLQLHQTYNCCQYIPCNHAGRLQGGCALCI